MADFGYDVSDYCDVDPLFGDLDDFDRLLADAHARGIRCSSTGCRTTPPTSTRGSSTSRSSRDDPKRDWYVWRDADADGDAAQQLDGRVRATSPAWTLDEATGQWYLHLFLPEQPDLELGATPRSSTAMHDVLRFWLDRGVDGFRIDVVHAASARTPTLPDDRAESRRSRTSPLNDDPSTHALLRGIRALLDGYPGDRMMVGEVYLLDTGRWSPRTTATATSCTSLQLPAAARAVGRRRAGGGASSEVERELDPRRAGRPGCSSNHDKPAPPHPLRRQRGRAPAPPPCCCSPCGARRSSTPARSWA